MIQFGLGNFYGEVIAYKKDDKFYMGLEDYSHMAQIEISETFYEAIQQEFLN